MVWSTTVGAVVGPNLFGPGEAIGRALGLPPFTGGFVIALCAQCLGAGVYFVGLRPDPLAVALARGGSVANRPDPAGGFTLLRTVPAARRAVLVVALSHAVMVSVMSMTPVHLTSHGATLSVVGLTISLHVAGMYALSPVFGWLADKHGRAATALATPAFTTGAAAAPSKTAFNTAGIDAALANLVRDGAVGMTTSVVGPGGTYLSAAGKRHLQKDSARPQDRARIASITKAMIAVLVMQRIEAGQ